VLDRTGLIPPYSRRGFVEAAKKKEWNKKGMVVLLLLLNTPLKRSCHKSGLDFINTDFLSFLGLLSPQMLLKLTFCLFWRHVPKKTGA